MARFTGKTVLITGAASGIGRAAARRFDDEGANVVAVDLDHKELEEASAQLRQERLLLQAGDTSNKDAATAAIKAAVNRFGTLNVLVNNAGIASKGDVTDTSEEDFDRVPALNVGGYFHMARAAMPELVKFKGSIVMTSSVSGLVGDWEMFAYNTSKGAVTNMVRAMALDAGKDGVRVNTDDAGKDRLPCWRGPSQEQARTL